MKVGDTMEAAGVGIFFPGIAQGRGYSHVLRLIFALLAGHDGDVQGKVIMVHTERVLTSVCLY